MDLGAQCSETWIDEVHTTFGNIRRETLEAFVASKVSSHHAQMLPPAPVRHGTCSRYGRNDEAVRGFGLNDNPTRNARDCLLQLQIYLKNEEIMPPN